jgi:aminoglycoside/choline kinase family phosphotransferase
MTLEAALRDQVARATGRPQEGALVQKLKGDASNRSYHRVGAWPDSVVVMVMPGHAKASEEAAGPELPSELPFVDVQRYLSKLGVRVPAILRYDEPAGMMVLEDLGDVTLEKALAATPAETLYGSAVDLLANLRTAAERRPDAQSIAFRRAFDEELYLWELHHFREWGLEAWSGKVPTPSETVVLEEAFRNVAQRLAAAPRGFTHRDYQSRNLMVKDGEVVVIDFQDALQGPRAYDLVALLRDSYVGLDEGLVDAMLHRYRRAVAQATGQTPDAADFRHFFDLLTLQRKLKDAARFEFIHRVKHNPSFLPHIPQSLAYVRTAFQRLPQDAAVQALRRVASRYVPELG